MQGLEMHLWKVCIDAWYENTSFSEFGRSLSIILDILGILRWFMKIPKKYAEKFLIGIPKSP